MWEASLLDLNGMDSCHCLTQNAIFCDMLDQLFDLEVKHPSNQVWPILRSLSRQEGIHNFCHLGLAVMVIKASGGPYFLVMASKF